MKYFSRINKNFRENAFYFKKIKQKSLYINNKRYMFSKIQVLKLACSNNGESRVQEEHVNIILAY